MIMTKHLFLFLLLIIIIPLKAEEREYDNEQWSKVEVKFPVSKDVKFSLAQQFRFNEDVSKFKSSLTDLALSYKINKNFKLAGTYRLKRVPDEIYNEYHLNGYYIQEIFSDFKLNFRTRYQARIPRGRDNRHNLRLKPQFTYKASEVFSPYIGVEYYYRFLYDEGDRFNKARYFVGTKIKFNKTMSMKLFYMLQREFNANKPKSSNILGLTYYYDL